MLPERPAQRQSGRVQPLRADRSSNFSSFPFILLFPRPSAIQFPLLPIPDAAALCADAMATGASSPPSSPLISRGGEHLWPWIRWEVKKKVVAIMGELPRFVFFSQGCQKDEHSPRLCCAVCLG